MSFRILGLDAAPFRPFYGLTTEQLAAHGITRHIADARPGFPDRIELRDADLGESLLLLNYTHQPANTAYRASHAIFIREGAETSYDAIDEIPLPLTLRPISLRAFTQSGEMIDADLAEGQALPHSIARLLENPKTAYLHAHYAKRGCYAARIERAP
jgi:hypothetical protein